MISSAPRFYLKCPHAAELTLKCMQKKYNGDSVFISTGNKRHPDNWDFDKQRAKVTRRNLSHGDINKCFDKIATEFNWVFRNCLIDTTEPQESLITQKLQEKLNLNCTLQIK